MKIRSVSIFLLLAMAKAVVANPVPAAKAKAVAAAFFNNTLQQNNLNRLTPPDLELARTENINTSRESMPAYYIFNNTAGSGFVIVAGDDAVDPIIGYSLENNVNANDLPVNFVSFMEAHKYAIGNAAKKNARASAEIEARWDVNTYSTLAATPVIKALVKPLWGQGSPYNDKCPKISGTHALVGCVAVAMGQIMQYWNYPVKGTGKKGGVDFGATTYDWKNMPISLNDKSGSKEINAVATLLYHCGVSANMDYGLKGSGTETPDALKALEKYFGYDDDAKIVHKYDYSLDDWKDLLKGQLDDGQPVFYAGFAEKKVVLGIPVYDKGHAWVCDGYDNEDKFHMNWGWNGAGDGYYRVTDLEPFTDEFQYRNDAIVDLVKPKRVKLSAISSTLSVMCKSQSFECSVTKQSAITAVNWTVPKGWSVDGKVSTGVAIKASFKVKIAPPTAFDKVSSITVRAVGLTTYGENTLARYVTIATGKPSFTKDKTILDIGSALHCFTPSKGATIQILDGGTWKNESCIELFNGAKKTVSVRASNTCGVSASQTFLLTSPIDIENKKVLGKNIDKNQEQAELRIYPNPAGSFITLQSRQKIVSVNCYNLIGEKTMVSLQENTIAVDNLTNGMYFLHVATADGKTSLHKFIKE